MRNVMLAVVSMLAISACGVGGLFDASASAARAQPVGVQETATRAVCGPGAQPENGLQGQVPLEDRQSGRSEMGYWCNLELVGQHQGTGASWQHAWYEDCAYYDTSFPSHQGVQVMDVTDPANPKLSTTLVTPAMLDPWESLKVNERRGLLGAVAGWNVAGPFFFDVYDVKADCKHPAMLASTPMDIPVGHEGDWAPDGLTYYSGVNPGVIDVTDPTTPVYIPRADANGSGHGLSLSDDGNRLYAVSPAALSATFCGNGLAIFDVSQIQARQPLPGSPLLGSVCWPDGAYAQHTIPVTIKGRPYVIFVDEGGKGAARIIDISDEKNPVVISKMKLEIHLPDNDTAFQADTANAGGFKYDGHYCGVDQRIEPTVVGCGYFQSGLRIFDIRDPYHPKEIAYYNPPAQGTKSLPGSNRFFPSYSGTSTSGYASSQVRFIKERGEVWFTDQDNGFMVVRFTNGVWPFK